MTDHPTAPVQGDDAELVCMDLARAVDELLSVADSVQRKAIAVINVLSSPTPETDRQEQGVPASPSGCRPSASAADASSLSGIPNAELLRANHEYYGPCDGFGPLWTCSACIGLQLGGDGYHNIVTGERVNDDDAAGVIGDFLLEKAERAALEAMGCCDGPAAVSEYMRRALIMDFPGNPWRHEALAASAIEARQRTDPEEGLDPEGESAVPNGETPNPGSTPETGLVEALTRFRDTVPVTSRADGCPWCLSKDHWAGRLELCCAPSSNAIVTALSNVLPDEV